jgi:hypothetical protein
VPYYDPWVVYGTWWWPAYPPVYWAPWPGYVRPGISVGIYWGSGVRLSAGFFFGAFDWHRRRVDVVYVNNYYYHPRVAHNVPLQWRHEPVHRRGVEYRHTELRQRYPHPVTRAAPRIEPRRAEPRRYEPQPGRPQTRAYEPRRDATQQRATPQRLPVPQFQQRPAPQTQQRPAPQTQQRPTPQTQQRATPQRLPVPQFQQRPAPQTQQRATPRGERSQPNSRPESPGRGAPSGQRESRSTTEPRTAGPRDAPDAGRRDAPDRGSRDR